MKRPELFRFAGLSSLKTPKMFDAQTGTATGSASIVIPAPSVADGDLMIAFLLTTSGSATMGSGPLGWIRLTTGSSSIRTEVWYKYALSESGTYTWTWSGTGNLFGGLLTWKNGGVPIAGAITNGTSSTTTAAAITIGALSAVAGMFGNGTNGTTSVSTPPVGMTLKAFENGTQPECNLYEVDGAAAGTFGPETAVWGSSSSTSGLLVEVPVPINNLPMVVATSSASGTGTTIVVNKPTGTVDGHLMFAWVSVNASGTYTGPAGWTEIADFSNVGGGAYTSALYYKIAASEGSSYTFTSTGSAASCGGILTLSHAAYDTIGTPAGGAGAVNFTTITVAANNSLLLGFVFQTGANGTTKAPPMGVIFNEGDSTAPGFGFLYQYVNSGATGTRTVTPSSAGCAGVLVSVSPS